MIQIIIKSYDQTLHRFNVPQEEANKITQQLTDREQELAAHEYHRSVMSDESNGNKQR